MSFEVVVCVHCRTKVALLSDGTCPSCRRNRNDPVNEGPLPSDTASANRPAGPVCPVSNTIIAWLFIVIGSINLVASAALSTNPTTREMTRQIMAQNPLPVPVQYALAYLGLTVMIVSGVGMLRGRNWARWLYAVWSVSGTVIQ